MPTPSLAVYFISSTLLANSANTNCRSIQVNFNCSKFIVDGRQQRYHMTFFYVIFFICNIENLFIAVFLPRKVIIILRKINFKRLSTVIVYSPSNSLGIFRHKCFKSTCEQVKSSNRLYYA